MQRVQFRRGFVPDNHYRLATATLGEFANHQYQRARRIAGVVFEVSQRRRGIVPFSEFIQRGEAVNGTDIEVASNKLPRRRRVSPFVTPGYPAFIPSAYA